MELSDYLAVLRRHWAIWIGATLVGALAAFTVFLQTPPTYEATAGVFVAPSGDGSAQFVQQRVKSYPEIVTSEAVLEPVVADLDGEVSIADLRSRVSADNPTETTQLYVRVTGSDPDETAAIANAVATRFADVVEELETPSEAAQPVQLTVADPAETPNSPVSPVLAYLLGLGVLAGLFLGLAAAVVRSRMDSRVHSEDDLRRAWGEDIAPEVLVQPSGRARRSTLTGQAAITLARRLELRAEAGPVRIVLLSPSPAEKGATRRFAADVAAALIARGVDAAVAGPDVLAGAATAGGPRVRLEVADPLAPLRVWRQVAERYDGVVLVVACGRVDAAEVGEAHRILRSAGITPLAVALVRRPRSRRSRKAAPAEPLRLTTSARTAPPSAAGTPKQSVGSGSGR